MTRRLAPARSYPARVLRLDFICPTCGHRPDIRIPESERLLARTQRPDDVKQIRNCQSCGRQIILIAQDYQNARVTFDTRTKTE